jgi:hypothetical protein
MHQTGPRTEKPTETKCSPRPETALRAHSEIMATLSFRFENHGKTYP